ncbi:transcription-repair coupling factor [Hutsoniella sourekii]
MNSSIYKEPFQQAVNEIQASQELPHLVTGIDDSARAVFLAQLFTAQPGQYIVVEPHPNKLNQLLADLEALLPEAAIFHFPEEETLAIEHSLASKDNQAMRIQVLNHLVSGADGIVATSVSGLIKRLIPVAQWRNSRIDFEVGASYDFSNLQDVFIQLGYQRVSLVEAPGEFSIRGSIIDFYALDQESPVRLDFFDVELDSIRRFDLDTQESIVNLDSVSLSPATDIIFSIEDQQSLLGDLGKSFKLASKQMQDPDLKEAFDKHFQDQLDQLEAGESLAYPSVYLGLFDPEDTNLQSYLQGDGHLIVMDFHKIQEKQAQILEENQYWIEQEVALGRLLPKLEIKLNAFELVRQSNQPVVYFSLMQRNMGNLKLAGIHNFSYRSMNQFFNQLPLIKTELDQWMQQGYLIQVCLPTQQEARRVQQLFDDHEIRPTLIQEGAPKLGAINILVQPLTRGFELPQNKWVVLDESALFAQRKQVTRRKVNLSNAERIKSYNELNVGDFVVHQSHGIGRYLGIETLEMKGSHRDMLTVEYDGSARIYIPVDQIHLLQKYVASESKTPKLNKLGSTDWAKTKQRVQSTVEDIADELIELYAKREQQKGYAFGPDTPEQAEFESAFPYVETEDQLKSAAEIKADMEKEKPMDRLLIGDVGYGKTEVAMRAIFKAVMEGKQVAFLVPTTILAQQHYNSLVERFQGWPFEIALMSRFVTQANQKETIEGLANGAVSIVVGTHRVLSKDIKFHDLGLLVVDEEQRFGVKHKERLKRLKSQVDVLTLTATPIPRTLHMSMIGIRDLSVIETPPSNRFPVQTYVMEQNDAAIRSAIDRELARGGQVFYLYNRVATIEQRAMEIKDLVPQARVAYAHGQLHERELEDILMAFVDGEYDVLVTTTIIETGVDIPNANTLFIENADKMGLSTLYQLRGRVGRTHRVAYAYLMYDPMKQMSEISEKRLNAIREFTELGSGFKIAMRDLSIRGAGNLLGQQQSGFIDSVGYDMYSQMLKEAVDRKRGKERPQSKVVSKELEWSIPVDAYIPSSYIDDERQKIQMYQDIQRIAGEEDYRQVQDLLIDRFGEFPDQVSDLLDIALIRYYALESGITSIKQVRQELEITFNEEASQLLQGVAIFEALEPVKLKAQIKLDKNRLKLQLNIYRLANDQWLSELIKLTQSTYTIVQREEQEDETR